VDVKEGPRDESGLSETIPHDQRVGHGCRGRPKYRPAAAALKNRTSKRVPAAFHVRILLSCFILKSLSTDEVPEVKEIVNGILQRIPVRCQSSPHLPKQ
jgi:hypothetical protein